MDEQKINMRLLYTASAIAEPIIERLLLLIEQHQLPLLLDRHSIDDKLSQKKRSQLSLEFGQPFFIVDKKQTLMLVTNGMSVSPEWKSLQQRVVTAGRKSELLLQACKITDTSNVLDATAGFGHDSLILASTGAQVTMLERHLFMALLLLYEQHKMLQHKNWQKLMARLDIRCQDASLFMQDYAKPNQLQSVVPFDVVYLDPMFPQNSYEHSSSSKGAKVGKHMQALHDIAHPPNLDEEQRLLDLALNCISGAGRVVVKRPIGAAEFANKPADVSWQNDVLRFDGYFNS